MNWSNPVLQAPISKSRTLAKSSKKEAPPETTEDASKHNYSRGDEESLSRARPRRKLPELQGALKLDLDPVRKNPTRRFIHPAFARGSGLCGKACDERAVRLQKHDIIRWKYPNRYCMCCVPSRPSFSLDLDAGKG
jgi:hypothetical protein